jgi:hypothetical protein
LKIFTLAKDPFGIGKQGAMKRFFLFLLSFVHSNYLCSYNSELLANSLRTAGSLNVNDLGGGVGSHPNPSEGFLTFLNPGVSLRATGYNYYWFNKLNGCRDLSAYKTIKLDLRFPVGKSFRPFLEDTSTCTTTFRKAFGPAVVSRTNARQIIYIPFTDFPGISLTSAFSFGFDTFSDLTSSYIFYSVTFTDFNCVSGFTCTDTDVSVINSMSFSNALNVNDAGFSSGIAPVAGGSQVYLNPGIGISLSYVDNLVWYSNLQYALGILELTPI